jgi:hypothetical protein
MAAASFYHNPDALQDSLDSQSAEEGTREEPPGHGCRIESAKCEGRNGFAGHMRRASGTWRPQMAQHMRPTSIWPNIRRVTSLDEHRKWSSKMAHSRGLQCSCVCGIGAYPGDVATHLDRVACEIASGHRFSEAPFNGWHKLARNIGASELVDKVELSDVAFRQRLNVPHNFAVLARPAGLLLVGVVK